jgi:hypothetical protein
MKKLLTLIPFLILIGISIYAIIEFISTPYVATWQHYLAFCLTGINGILYFVRFRPAVLATGIILVLGTINLLSFFPETVTSGLRFGSFETPRIQLSMLGLLVLYIFLEFDLLVNWYLDLKG